MSATDDASRSTTQRVVETAIELSEAVGDGHALVFARGEEGEPRLRAAAGFDSPDSARAAARALAGSAREALDSDEVVELADVPELGDPPRGGLFAQPLRLGGERLGAALIGAPAPLSPEQWHRMGEIAKRLARLLAPGPGAPGSHRGRQDGDEMLRLSEALLAQDVELMRHREKLGTIERLKDDFIEKMSRELRTPLNHIIEAIISVLTSEDAALSESSKSALRTALDEGSAFQRTLQNILDLWRIKQGELPVEIQDVNFRELVDEAIFSVQDTVGDRAVVIETKLAEPLPRLRTDLTKLNQILFLLLDNAVKFTPQGHVQIIGEASEDELRVEIRDDGIGICHDDLELVFDEFYQVDSSASQKYRGAGLGLTLVRDLVALLDGQLAVESDIGRGTRVTMTLPVQTL